MWPIYIDGGTCDAALVGRVASLARVELGEALVDAPPAPPACRVRLECSGKAVVIAATLPRHAAQAQVADLSNAAESVWPRVIALAIAEVVRDVESEPEEQASTGVRVHAPGTVPSPRKRVLLRAFAAASSFDLAHWLAGGGIGFDYASDSFFIGSDVAFVTREDDAPLGNARTFLLSVSPELGRQWTSARFAARLGLGFALGVAQIDGHSTSTRAAGDTLGAVWGGPFAGAGIGYGLGESMRVEIRAKVGWAALPVVADVAGTTPIRLEPAWVALELSAAFLP